MIKTLKLKTTYFRIKIGMQWQCDSEEHVQMVQTCSIFLKECSTNFTHDQFKYQQLEDYKYLIWSLQYKLRSVAFEREALTG